MAARSTPKQWGLIGAIIAYFVGTILAGVGLAVGSTITGYRQGSGQPLPLTVTVLELTGLWIGLVAGVVLYSRYLATGHLRDDLGLRLRWPFDIIVGTVAGVGTQLVLIRLLYLPFEWADPTFHHRLEAPARIETAAAHGTWQVLLLLLFLAIGAPIVEELFFRGLLLWSISRWLGPVVGVVGSAILFGAAHGQLLQLPALVLFGLILGLLAQRTGRLGPGIVAHVTFNAVTVITFVVGTVNAGH